MFRFTSLVLLILTVFHSVDCQKNYSTQKGMLLFGDTSRTGTPFSKDPHVIGFEGRYLMYYSVPQKKDTTDSVKGWGIGISESRDLLNWIKIGEITPATGYESKGLCAPCVRVIENKIHIFYQTYGNGAKDAICHAWSDDGINFTRNPTNPIFRPDGSWNCGRAIDAEVKMFKGRYYLYYATRDPDYKIQMQGVATADADTDFSRSSWKNLSTDGPMLRPELPWEMDCIEGASVIEHKGKLYMFYAGGYNNAPQQIGIAVSSDGTTWKRMSESPFLPNGLPGEWNSSESGHPHIFKDRNNKTWLFYQGNNDNGKTWFISNVRVLWNRSGPVLKKL